METGMIRERCTVDIEVGGPRETILYPIPSELQVAAALSEIMAVR